MNDAAIVVAIAGLLIQAGILLATVKFIGGVLVIVTLVIVSVFSKPEEVNAVKAGVCP